jgi:hypothetical protein
MKTLIFVDELPFPITNGITAATSSICKILSQLSEVNVFNYKSNNLYTLKESGSLIPITNLNYKDYKIIIASPILPSLALLKILKKENLDPNVLLISWLNDCYVYALYNQIFLDLKFGLTLKKIPFNLLKIPYYYFKEKLIAKKFHFVILQTPVDLKIFKSIYKNNNTFNIPNSIEENNISNLANLPRPLLHVAYVATFKGSYLNIANWFIKKIWSKILNDFPNAKLHITGSGKKEFANSFLEKFPKVYNSIVVEDYYDDINLFYKKVNVAVAPIFKGYGLINKTVDAMKNGVIVVGDTFAFNGIEGIQDGKHCIIANNSNDFIKAISECVTEDKKAIRQNAITIINKNFSVSKCQNKLFKIINV